jgi:hypothetical protein
MEIITVNMVSKQIFTRTTSPVTILLLTLGIIVMILLNTFNIIKGSTENSIGDINLNSSLNNTFNLGAPFLVDYSTTTALTSIGIRTPDTSTEDFEVTFSGFGIINHDNNTIKHTSNSSGIYITNPDGTVYQKGIMKLRSEEGNDTATAEYESIGYQANKEIVLDNGIIFFNSSIPNGELSFLNNRMAVYKDKIEGGLNITTIAWQWK